ncbi:PepSY-like domain-containing protein [Campylobacter sp. MIT 21-1685]|uniref:PepSY-like domain-containing protein n=1 Tax=unclassified Campylobacter TaxID=2593542 RepID=UPI00224A8C16|nr:MULTISPECIES: PepSY-like domain-containing protein [unclassified Campylobacter]MCX2682940.1 PepSY-like domain-containing protein [Campylobacter sp. MIT 21-1684]MCX2751222.1 PepSY-like domain-containing protein [Campylobacter sp. MIT 21-1682]MCX2807421.1 PepSY-like domain-containing protein [Campylobacter sp. MIT 21-1685]
MKNTFFILVFIPILLYGDIIISPDSLPSTAKEFLRNNFQAQISLVQRDKNSYEVYLSDGTELEFDIDGSWKEIESKILPINVDILPSNLAAIIKNEFPNVPLKEIDKKINYYKIKLVNGFELVIDFNGTILYKGIDD